MTTKMRTPTTPSLQGSFPATLDTSKLQCSPNGAYTITPSAAATILQAMQVSGFINRPFSQDTANKYAADMRSRRFWANGQPLIFDLTGICIDGQHRLSAVISTGIALRTYCVFGIPREAARTIDQGRSRTVSHAIHMDGTKNAIDLVAAARTLHALRASVDPESPTGKRFAFSHAEELQTANSVRDFITMNPSLEQALDSVTTGYRILGSRPEIAAVLTEFRLLCGPDSQRPEAGVCLADQWLMGMAGGFQLDDPRTCLRERLIADKMAKTSVRKNNGRGRIKSRELRLSMFVKSWNMFLANKKTTASSFAKVAAGKWAVITPLAPGG